MSGILRWENPPAPARRGGRDTPDGVDWYRIAAQLRARPGEWAAIAEGVETNAPAYIRSARSAAFRPAGAFDAVGRQVRGVYTLYARYRGEVDGDG